jgi:hypothetical protein
MGSRNPEFVRERQHAPNLDRGLNRTGRLSNGESADVERTGMRDWRPARIADENKPDPT